MLVLPDRSNDPSEVQYAAVWKPRPGKLATLPNLRVIFNLGAGVDALMADASLPNVPLVRVAASDLTGRMTDYVTLYVLMHHRQEMCLRESQREKRWAPSYQWAAGRDHRRHHGNRHARDRRGADATGDRLSRCRLEPQRQGGSRRRALCRQLGAFLRETNILVCLLPLTPDTRHVLNRDLFAKLNRSSPIRAPGLINAGRGGLQDEAGILRALETARWEPPRSTSSRPNRCRRKVLSGAIRRWC